MIGNLKIKNNREAIKQLIRCNYEDILNVTSRINGETAYVINGWLQLPERTKLEKAGFYVAKTIAGNTFIHEGGL